MSSSIMATPFKVTKAYEKVINFIAAGMNTSDVIAFQPSNSAKER
jgi:hypothetical protein